MKMRTMFFALSAGVLLSTAAIAGDLSAPMPAKAPAVVDFGTYPTNNGWIVSLFTEGGGGPVSASVPGVPPASLTTTTAAIGATVGYMYTPKNSPVGFSLEGDVCAQNFNGNNAGFAVQGPLCFAERVMVYAPWQKVLAALPSLPNPFSGISAFSFPSGITAVGNAQAGLGLEVREADISTAFAGVQSGKVWRENVALVAMNVQPLSNGTALRGWIKFDFAGGSKVFGAVPAGQTVATLGTGARAGLGVAF